MVPHRTTGYGIDDDDDDDDGGGGDDDELKIELILVRNVYTFFKVLIAATMSSFDGWSVLTCIVSRGSCPFSVSAGSAM